MRRDIGAPIGGSQHCGLKLFEQEFGDVDRIIVRRNAAASHQLDLAGALHELLSRGFQHGITAIG